MPQIKNPRRTPTLVPLVLAGSRIRHSTFFSLRIGNGVGKQGRGNQPHVDDKDPSFATRAAIYRSLRALRARNLKKVSKRVFLGVWRKVSKKHPPLLAPLLLLTFALLSSSLHPHPFPCPHHPIPVGARNRYHLSFWRFCPCFIALFGTIWGQSM